MKLIAGEQRFQGFSRETFRFLRGLAEHPSKAYWDSHREIYRREVLIPMRHLLAALEAEFGPGKVLSMRRDNRFSPNPAPYKSYLGAVIYRESGMCYYVEISPEGMMAAGGWRFNHPADQVGRFRAAIDREASGQAFERIATCLREDRFELAGDRIKTVPKGYPADHPRAEWLRYKTVCAEYRWPVEDWMFTEEVLQRVESAWRKTQPLIDWLEMYVGPSTLTCR